jgi:hypothetical protein
MRDAERLGTAARCLTRRVQQIQKPRYTSRSASSRRRHLIISILLELNADESKNFLEALERDFEPPKALLDLKKHYDSFNITDRT